MLNIWNKTIRTSILASQYLHTVRFKCSMLWTNTMRLTWLKFKDYRSIIIVSSWSILRGRTWISSFSGAGFGCVFNIKVQPQITILEKQANLYFYANNVRLFTAAILKIFFSHLWYLVYWSWRQLCIIPRLIGYRFLYCKAILFLKTQLFLVQKNP